MNKLFFSGLFLSGAVILASCGSGEQKKEEVSADQKEDQRYELALQSKKDLFGKLPAAAENAANPASEAKINLGHALYFDKNLSKDGNISCNSCHNLETFGVDNLPNSPGDGGKNGDRNSPTVLNAALHSTQFWDGRAKDVEEQAGMPILNPIEMAIPDKGFLVNRLSKLAHYQSMFKEAFPGEAQALTYDNLQKAIASFERQLITPSRFDAWLNGDAAALSLQEKKGLSTFINVGCTSCHSGPVLGGTMLQKFGVHQNYWELTGVKEPDKGRAKVTNQEADQYVFKVPSLRNIEKTAPYFHDGSVKDLNEAVKIMAKAQLKIELTKEELENLVAFLKALTGEVPAKYKKAPVMAAK